ncbi:copper amine oxidase N-terminal domain-containing protein [Brevibacillus sp. SYSU BS000544]|uniref:copper amine oxidase N-terminal domain-containing protein n=1 Tax=Brevibacillus sp. SYSU BS000544 TaxID=3416443 RepID=UPI003CE595B1
MFGRVILKETRYLFLIVLFVVLFLQSIFGIQKGSAAEEQKIVTVVIDGQVVKMQGQEAVLIGETVYVPVIAVFEKLGINIEWDKLTKTLYGYQSDSLRIEMNSYSDTGKLDGQRFLMDQPPIIMNETIMVPSTLITQLLKYGIEYDHLSHLLKINTDQIVEVDPYASYQKVMKEITQKYNLTPPDEKAINKTSSKNIKVIFRCDMKICKQLARFFLFLNTKLYQDK